MAEKKKVWEMTRAEKLEYLRETADNALDKATENKANWREFLKFYANVYKYPFSEALTIYEQNHGFTACAEIEQWNKRGRLINKGEHGTPVLIEATSTIKYYFDVSQTYGDERGLPKFWELPEKYKSAVVDELRSKFGVKLTSRSGDNNIKWAVEEYVRAESLDFMENLRYNIAGSFLEDLDEDNIRREFEETVVDSVGYLVCERLKIDKGLYDNDELAFQFMHDFNTPPAISKVGEAVNHISTNVLNLIYGVILHEQKLEEVRDKVVPNVKTQNVKNRVRNCYKKMTIRFKIS